MIGDVSYRTSTENVAIDYLLSGNSSSWLAYYLINRVQYFVPSIHTEVCHIGHYHFRYTVQPSFLTTNRYL
jgi:hypothetical protein